MAKKRMRNTNPYAQRLKEDSEARHNCEEYNDGYDEMNWPSHRMVTCEKCGAKAKVHMLYIKLYNCPCLSLTND